jgi:hypothetical protein
MEVKMSFFNLLSLSIVTLCAAIPAYSSQQAALESGYHQSPEIVSPIPDQTIFANGDACGPNALYLDLSPYFTGFGEPLTFCLSSCNIQSSPQGAVSQLKITLDPFTGLLSIPPGWFAVWATLDLNIVVKNPYGSAEQSMRVYLLPCGG